MLIMKEPIRLTADAGMTTVSDDLAERIAGNYRLADTSFTPKELLLLLSAPPEFPEMDGGMTSIAVDSRAETRQILNLEVVNNIVNRVLLADSSRFTYQDNVYITTALHKLGITDVAQFISQARTLCEETKNIRALFERYGDRIELLRQLASPLEPPARKASRKSASGRREAPPPREPQVLHLHNEIYSRLQTGDVYHTMRQHLQNNLTNRYALNARELAVAEQQRVADQLSLYRIKRQIGFGDSLSLHHHINRYELGDILPPPVTEEQALSQGAAAVLLNLIDKTMTTRLSSHFLRASFWNDVSQAIWQSAANSLQRFESHHRGEAFYQIHGDEYSRRLSALFQEETNVLNRLSQIFSQTGAPVSRTDVSIREGNISIVSLEHRRQLEQISATNLFEALGQLGAAETTLIQATTKNEINIAESLAAIIRNPLFSETTRKTLLLEYPRVGRSVSVSERRSYEESVSTELLRQLAELEPAPAPVLGETPVPPGTLSHPVAPEPGLEAGGETAPVRTEAEAAEERLMLSRLEEINRENRRRLEQMTHTRIEALRRTEPQAPDRRRTIQDALRAIENPEQVLTELIGEPASMEHRRPPSEVEAILSQTDEVTRRVYEEAMRYQGAPGEPGGGGVRTGTPAILNAEAEEIRRQTPLALAHPDLLREEELRRITETTERVTTQFLERPVIRERAEAVAELVRPPVRTVHRRQEDGISEEILERLDERRRETTRQTVQETQTVRTQTTQTEVLEQTRETVAHSTEDVAEIVNRTLARQLGMISDRVYSQMERRLQTERARRGK